jgi:ammonia channel protein AmtB
LISLNYSFTFFYKIKTFLYNLYLVGGSLSYFFCKFKKKLKLFDGDSLDVFGCHGVSGIWGGLAVGF